MYHDEKSSIDLIWFDLIDAIYVRTNGSQFR